VAVERRLRASKKRKDRKEKERKGRGEAARGEWRNVNSGGRFGSGEVCCPRVLIGSAFFLLEARGQRINEEGKGAESRREETARPIEPQ
jgi:hypothetical protein